MVRLLDIGICLLLVPREQKSMDSVNIKGIVPANTGKKIYILLELLGDIQQRPSHHYVKEKQ